MIFNILSSFSVATVASSIPLIARLRAQNKLNELNLIITKISNIANQEIRFPLHHPINMVRSKKRDSFTEFGQFFKPFFLRVIYKIFRPIIIKHKIY